ncbi:MAG: amidohydrolase [Flavobacteriales bacterium]|nr:amidohydrolase [Flavobacteriales bacterium]
MFETRHSFPGQFPISAIRVLVYFLLPLAFTGASCNFQSHKADVILHNGTVVDPGLYSDLQGSSPASAIAVKDGRILEVGPERTILNKYSAPLQVDLRKSFVYPGFMDAHAHFVGYASGLANADLMGTTSWPDVLDRLEAHVQAHDLEPEAWILGRGWDHNDWPVASDGSPAAFPSRFDELESRFSDHPVLLWRVDGHALIANERALSAAGFTTDTRMPGGVLLQENGELTGLLIDLAADSLQSCVPPLDSARRVALIHQAEQNILAAGLTHVTDAGLNRSDIDLLAALHLSGKLKLRIEAMVSDNPSSLDHYLASGPVITDRLHVKSFKFYMDGSLGSRGAALVSPYSDRTGHSGYLLQDPADFRVKLERLHAAGFQAATHCIGDSAVRTALTFYKEVLGGVNDRRWRIEHAQVVHPDDIERFAAATVIPSVQPTHATSDMYWAGERLGRNRVRRAYVYKELQDVLGLLPLGTDFPVEDISPLKTFRAATLRTDAEGFPRGGFQPENALDRRSALQGLTQWPALACFRERDLGHVAAGYWADFTILDRNLLTVSDEDLPEARVLQTWIAGQQLYAGE